MAATDAKAFPFKNAAYRVTFPILDADGDPVTGATGLDSEVSKDGATFADCTNEATEIASASGVYYLDLTSTEMNADTVAVQVKTTSSGAKTTVLVFYPLAAGDIAVNVTQFGGTTVTARDIGASVLLSPGTGTGQVNLSSGAVPVTGDLSATMKTSVQAELTTYGALKPTTVGRTLDVSTGGEAGLDWANIGAPTTAQNLSGTNIKTDQVVASVTNPVTLTSAYDAAKTAANQTSVNTIDDFVDTEVGAIKTVTDKLDLMLEYTDHWRYTAGALETAPSGGGGGGDASQATLLAVKAKTDNLPSDPADASDIAASFATVNSTLSTISSSLPLDASELNAIADALLKRDWTAISGEASYSVLQALRMLRNVWNTTGGTLTVHKEDGSTPAWTRTLSTDASAEPITGAS